jgi:hypothetical protein
MAQVRTLEQRVAALEEEVTRLKAGLCPAAAQPAGQPSLDEEPLGDQLLREAREGRAELVAAWAEVMKELGIHDKPIGAKKLRERMIADGMDPKSNSFSRELIAMREE